jgi:hypothetical protein
MNEAVANISWLPFDPRDWEQLTPAFGRLRSTVGAHGPKLIVNNRAAAFFDRCVHEGRLELALVTPDLTTYRLFDAEERQKLAIRVPLNYEEGCGMEPYYEGYWYVRRSGLEKLTAIPVTPVAELAPARTPPAEPASAPPAESPRVESSRDVGAADAPVQGTQVKSGGPLKDIRPSKEDWAETYTANYIAAERKAGREPTLTGLRQAALKDKKSGVRTQLDDAFHQQYEVKRGRRKKSAK